MDRDDFYDMFVDCPCVLHSVAHIHLLFEPDSHCYSLVAMMCSLSFRSFSHTLFFDVL